MLVWKSWFDLSKRFYWCMGALFLLAAITVAIYPLMGSIYNQVVAEPSSPITPSSPIGQAMKQTIQDYRFYIDTSFYIKQTNMWAIMAIVLALAGILSEKRKDMLMMMISLPVKRQYWVLMHAGLAALLSLIITTVATGCILLGSPIIGKSYPLGPALLNTLLLWLSCLFWIGASLLLNSFLRSGWKSAIILIPISLIWSTLAGIPRVYRWSPWPLANPFIWHQGIPWAALAISLIVSVGGTVLAMLKFVQKEY